MNIDLTAIRDRCALCGFDFTAPPNTPLNAGFGKKLLLEESRKYVKEAYKLLGSDMEMPAPGHCPACWFALTPERLATILPKLPKLIFGVG